MSDLDQFVFCKWQGRLWPAKILSKSPSKASETVSDCLDVKLICLDKQLCVKHRDTRPFEQKQAEDISSGLEVHKEDFTHEEAVEELTYRKALRIALNTLANRDSHIAQMTIKEPVMAKTRVLTSKELKEYSCVHNANKTQNTPKKNGLCSLQGQETVCTRQSSRKLSFINKLPEVEQEKRLTRSCTLTPNSTKMKNHAGKEKNSGVRRSMGRPRKNLFKHQPNTSCGSHTRCEQPLPVKQEATDTHKYRGEDRLRNVGKSSIPIHDSKISGEGKDQNGEVKIMTLRSRVIWKSACKEVTNSSVQFNCKPSVTPTSDSRSYLESTPKRRTSDNIVSHECSHFLRSRNVQLEVKSNLGQNKSVEQQKKRKGNKCPEPVKCLHTSTTSADLDINVRSSNQPKVDDFTGTRNPMQQVNGHKRSISDNSQMFYPTTQLNKQETFPPSKIQKEEEPSKMHTLSTAEPDTTIQSPAFQVDEIVEFSSVDSLSTSKRTDNGEEDEENDDEDENLPSILLHQEQWSVTEGMLVWCKFQKYPYWPAVVRSVKPRIKKASILFVDENIIDVEKNKKGFTVSVRTLKPFDCENRHQLTAAARYIYKTSVDWCVALIDDYRIRRGCGSFTGSFVEYCTAELSIPVRKTFGQDPSLMTFPYSSIANQVAGGHSDSEVETTPSKQHPTKKLLPDRKKAARDRANEKLVQFIVKAKGAEKHLQAVIKGQKPSRWLEEFNTLTRNSSVIDTYLEDDWQLDQVVNYLKAVCEMSVSTKHLEDYERSRFILDVLLPEAIICAIAEVEQMSIKKAEEKYMKGPLHSEREVEHFNKEIEKEMKLKQKLLKKEESTS
ncbi:PWWP domain-containing DNA repair factor 3A-like isoform X2 [Hemiscyllium ocellatum]|uniref:PWWP domain-containing DNA repair factor 3A-like isoform X2 n=1 Tax=Hemiscyllium ocellatum TaxID=170820 RepID=UPI0029677685|nr:PWWP domain-containing DNA repair factor 3A-like isoform X2 [Hemiscyllium ocellatum]